MASKSKEQQSPVKRRFSSPLGNQKYVTKGISPRFKANLKDFRSFGPVKQSKQRGDLGPNHGRPWRKPQKGAAVRFHFGGNSADPLNLNSLIDRDPAVVTPQASPLSVHSESPVEVLEPRDKTDPLNLKGFLPEPENNTTHVTPKKRKKKKRPQNTHHDTENEIGAKEQSSVLSQQHGTLSEGKRKRKKNPAKTEEMSHDGNRDDEASTCCTDQCTAKSAQNNDNSISVEELEPSPKKKASISLQTSAEVDNKNNVNTKMEDSSSAVKAVKTSEKHPEIGKCHGSHKGKDPKRDKHHSPGKHKRKEKLFIYGNYNRYYGYRNPQCSQDLRLKCFNKEWFQGKAVLDLGCNVGHVTLTIARDFNPQVITGIDIDPSLIKAAKNNLRYYVQSQVSVPGTSRTGRDFPMSFSVTSGPLAAPVVLSSEEKPAFPHNVVFKQVINTMCMTIRERDGIVGCRLWKCTCCISCS